LTADVIVETYVLTRLDLVNAAVVHHILLLGLWELRNVTDYHLGLLHHVHSLRNRLLQHDLSLLLRECHLPLCVTDLLVELCLVCICIVRWLRLPCQQLSLHLEIHHLLLLVENEGAASYLVATFDVLEVHGMTGVARVLELLKLVASGHVSELLTSVQDGVRIGQLIHALGVLLKTRTLLHDGRL